jgi:hydrogenase maturation protease
MTPMVRVIGIGQRAAGDDGVGPMVIERLRAEGGVEGATLHEVPEPSALIPLIEGADRIILIDAALGDAAPGEVLVVGADALDTRGLVPVSTHGLSVGQAVALARAVAPERVCCEIRVVAVVIEKPACLGAGLTSAAMTALPRAVAAVRALAAQPAG